MRSIRGSLPENAQEELTDLLKQCRNDRETRKVQAVLFWVKNGWNREQIAQATGYAKTTVRDFQLKFLQAGAGSLLRRERPTERHQYLKREQEAEFLKSFHQSALEGELVSALDIQDGYEKRIGKKGGPVNSLSTAQPTWVAQNSPSSQASQR